MNAKCYAFKMYHVYLRFIRNQNQGSADTINRKLFNAAANTCILKNELNLQYGTKKDSSCKILNIFN